MSNKDKVYNAIKQYFYNNGYSPCIRELVRDTGIKSTATIHKYIVVLEAEGKITRKKNISRTIRLVEKDD